MWNSSKTFEFDERTIDDSQEAFDDIVASQFDTVIHDIQFLCENNIFTANKLILQSSSMFWRNFFSDNKGVTLIEIHYAKNGHFRSILEYFYNGRITFGEIIEAACLTALATKYELNRLVDDLLDCMQESLDFDNIWNLLHSEITEEVENACFQFLDKNAELAVKCPEMIDLSYKVFKSIIRRDSFDAPEMAIFEMTCKWLEKHVEHRKIIKYIRFQSMTAKECENILRENSNLVTEADIKKSLNCEDHKPRGQKTLFLKLEGKPEYLNIKPELMKVFLCNINSGSDNVVLESDSMQSGFKLPSYMSKEQVYKRFSHTFIEIRIPVTLINSIQIRLENDENDDQNFAFRAFVANDTKKWKLIANKTKNCAHGLQVMFFEPIEVREIKILGVIWKSKEFTSNAWFPYVLKKFNSSKLYISFTSKSLLTLQSIPFPLNTNVFTNFWGVSVFVANKRVKNAITFNEKTSSLSKKRSPLCLNIKQSKSYNYIDIVLSQTFIIQALEISLWSEGNTETFDFNVSYSPTNEHVYFDISEQKLNSVHESHSQYFNIIAEIVNSKATQTIPFRMKNVAVISIECIRVNGKESGDFRIIELRNTTFNKTTHI